MDEIDLRSDSSPLSLFFFNFWDDPLYLIIPLPIQSPSEYYRYLLNVFQNPDGNLSYQL